MNVMQKYIDLEKQKKVIRRDMKQKRDAITCEVSSEEINKFGDDFACVKKMDVLGMGVGCKFTQIEVAYCNAFCENNYCPNAYCRMFRKNNSYINSVNLYETVKQAQWNLIKDALKIKKK